MYVCILYMYCRLLLARVVSIIMCIANIYTTVHIIGHVCKYVCMEICMFSNAILCVHVSEYE